jgi:hypothetical protein
VRATDAPTPAVCLGPPAAWAALTPLPRLHLSLAEVRLLLRALLPPPVLDAAAALALLHYQQRRKAAAYRAHRKRTLRRLAAPQRPEVSLSC